MALVQTVKYITTFVVSSGAGAIVSNALKSTNLHDLNPIRKGIVGIGAFALSGLIGSKTAEHVNKQIDELAALGAAINMAVQRNKNKKEDENGES